MASMIDDVSQVFIVEPTRSGSRGLSIQGFDNDEQATLYLIRRHWMRFGTLEEFNAHIDALHAKAKAKAVTMFADFVDEENGPDEED